MGQLRIGRARSLGGQIRVPGDKSISHRTLLLGCLADGRSHVRGFLPSADCLATLSCVRALGIQVQGDDTTTLTIQGRGLHGLQRPEARLSCARSGTTMRLLAGILAGQAFEGGSVTLTGDPQLLRRPMRRIATPLRRMGADIETTEGHAPLTIRGAKLHGCEHRLPVASAQVKSAILLAALYADGATIVHQPGPARDHTELMLKAMGADVKIAGLTVTLTPRPSPLRPLSFSVPGDISSACFPLAAGLLAPDGKVTVEHVGINPTRTGLLDVLHTMGADITVKNRREEGCEPVADVQVNGSRLHGTEVRGPTVVRMIDEFPLLAVVATQARGVTSVRDAAELRVKETDRIVVIAHELKKLGARIDPQPEGFLVTGPTRLRGTVVDSHGDHRIAMALAVAGLVAQGETVVENADCIADSFPGFKKTLRGIGARIA